MTVAPFNKKDYILRNARVPEAIAGNPQSGALLECDIIVRDGLIAEIRPADETATDLPQHDCDQGLVFPTFVDAHTHLDKGHMWPRTSNPDGSWDGALRSVFDDHARDLPAEDIIRRMDFALRAAYAHGTAAIRTHLDSVPPRTETVWDAFRDMRERWADRIELQAVSLIGTDHMLDSEIVEIVAQEVKASGGVLGGSAKDHPDTRKAIFNIVEKAGEFGLDLDLHCDETGNPDAHALLSLADAVLKTGFNGRVVAGHCCALAMQEPDRARATMERAIEAGITIVSLPMCNMFLQDRWSEDGTRTPRWRGVTPLTEYKAMGGTALIASDNTRDPFYAYGDLDGLEVFREGARILHFDYPREQAFTWLRAVTADAAKATDMTHKAEIAPGQPADLVLFRARHWTELMARSQADRLVLRRGQPIEQTLPDYRELDDLTGAE